MSHYFFSRKASYICNSLCSLLDLFLWFGFGIHFLMILFFDTSFLNHFFHFVLFFGFLFLLDLELRTVFSLLIFIHVLPLSQENVNPLVISELGILLFDFRLFFPDEHDEPDSLSFANWWLFWRRLGGFLTDSFDILESLWDPRANVFDQIDSSLVGWRNGWLVPHLWL